MVVSKGFIRFLESINWLMDDGHGLKESHFAFFATLECNGIGSPKYEKALGIHGSMAFISGTACSTLLCVFPCLSYLPYDVHCTAVVLVLLRQI